MFIWLVGKLYDEYTIAEKYSVIYEWRKWDSILCMCLLFYYNLNMIPVLYFLSFIAQFSLTLSKIANFCHFRIFALNLLNLYTLFIALFWKQQDMVSNPIIIHFQNINIILIRPLVILKISFASFHVVIFMCTMKNRELIHVMS